MWPARSHLPSEETGELIGRLSQALAELVTQLLLPGTIRRAQVLRTEDCGPCFADYKKGLNRTVLSCKYMGMGLGNLYLNIRLSTNIGLNSRLLLRGKEAFQGSGAK